MGLAGWRVSVRRRDVCVPNGGAHEEGAAPRLAAAPRRASYFATVTVIGLLVVALAALRNSTVYS